MGLYIFKEFIGHRIIEVEGLEEGSGEVLFYLDNNKTYKMYHNQCCCEDVSLEDIEGDIEDILNKEIVMFEELSATESEDKPLSDDDESFTWTFYKIGTNKGGITLRWYGTSNGYYSESVDICKVK